MMLDLFVGFVWAVITVCVAAAIGFFFWKNPKYIVAVIAIVMLFGAYIAGASAENVNLVVVEDYKVEAVVVNGEPLLLITFQYEEEYLSFYWEGELENRPLLVTIWADIEVIDVVYIEEQASA